jgi:RNase P/RNase MRP subunit p30
MDILNSCYDYASVILRKNLLLQIPEEVCLCILVRESCEVGKNTVLELLKVMGLEVGNVKQSQQEILVDLVTNTMEDSLVDEILVTEKVGLRYLKHAIIELDQTRQIGILFSYLDLLSCDSYRLFVGLYVFFSGLS